MGRVTERRHATAVPLVAMPRCDASLQLRACIRNHSDSASLSLAFIDSGHANSPQSGGGEVRPLTSTTTAKSGP